MNIYDYTGETVYAGIITDKTLQNDGEAADSKVVGDMFESLGTSAIEPMGNDIPEIYFEGTLPTSKTDGNVPVKVEYISKTSRFAEYATLKVQGDSSTGYPKKNFTIKFYDDEQCTVKSKHDFKGWGEENKFVLKANWIDITHARNIVSVRLWTDVVRTRSDYDSLPASMLASPRLATIDGFPVKVYANGIYQGRYTFNIPKDAWMYNMDDESENDVVLCSDTWEAGSFNEETLLVDETDWTDEIHETVPQSVITKINAFNTFVRTATDVEFMANVSNYVDLQSCIDFYIFVQVTAAEDNCAKNLIFMSYDGSPYIAGAYDFDSTFGLYWNGTQILPTTLESTVQMQQNRFYMKIASLYSTQVATRYAELRASVLSAANIIHRFEEFMGIMPRELVEEDYASTTANGAFTEIPSRNITSIQQIRNYIVGRLEYVDSQILT